jgi:hypothetical protein
MHNADNGYAFPGGSKMNPGVGEEGVKVVGGIVESLRQQPLSLALVIMNIALLALFFYIGKTVAATREREINLLYTDQKEIRELLSRCVVPPSKESNS